jgi:hypothetical protein
MRGLFIFVSHTKYNHFTAPNLQFFDLDFNDETQANYTVPFFLALA